MPRNSDFDYKGLKVEHVNDFNAIDYHNQSLHPAVRKDIKRQPPQAMKGVHSVPPKDSTDTKSLYEQQRDQAVERAAAEDWRTRGLSNNEIIDH